MKKILLTAAALWALLVPATANPLPLNCGDIVSCGWASMPDVADYFPRPLPGALAFSSTPCNLDSFVFAQCFAEPRWTVKQAIDAIIRKAAHRQRLPEVPQCGA